MPDAREQQEVCYAATACRLCLLVLEPGGARGRRVARACSSRRGRASTRSPERPLIESLQWILGRQLHEALARVQESVARRQGTGEHEVNQRLALRFALLRASPRCGSRMVATNDPPAQEPSHRLTPARCGQFRGTMCFWRRTQVAAQHGTISAALAAEAAIQRSKSPVETPRRSTRPLIRRRNSQATHIRRNSR